MVKMTAGKSILVLARFFCSRKGAATGRAMITVATAILLGLLGFAGTVGKWGIEKGWEMLERIDQNSAAASARAESLAREFADWKMASGFRTSARDRQVTGLENDVEDHRKMLMDHEKRLYRIEAR